MRVGRINVSRVRRGIDQPQAMISQPGIATGLRGEALRRGIARAADGDDHEGKEEGAETEGCGRGERHDGPVERRDQGAALHEPPPPQ